MKIVHLTHGLQGGANRAAINLIEKQNEAGLDVAHLVWNSEGVALGENVLIFAPTLLDSFAFQTKKIIHKLQGEDYRNFYFVNYVKNGYEYFAPACSPFKGLPKLAKQADIVHVHFAPGFFHVNWLGQTKAPVVATLHDFHLVTGGCPYPMGCDKFHHFCDKCPQQVETQQGMAAYNFMRKKKAYEKGGLFFVANTNATAKFATQSALVTQKEIPVVPYNLDFSSFPKKDFSTITKDRVIILVGAENVAIPRKGGNLLFAFVESLAKLNCPLELLTFGSSKPAFDFPTISHTHLGYQSGREAMAQLYQRADIYVSLSLHETFGLTVSEALSCGIPVVGIDNGGIRDIVEEGRSGYISPGDDLQFLTEKIKELIDDPERRRKFGEYGARSVREKFSDEKAVNGYLEIYEQLLKGK